MPTYNYLASFLEMLSLKYFVNKQKAEVTGIDVTDCGHLAAYQHFPFLAVILVRVSSCRN